MIPKTILTAALLCGTPLAFASAAPMNAATSAVAGPAGVAILAAIGDDYAALAAEYDAATVEFAVKLKAADKSARRELRANSPIKQFWPRFTAMSEAGEGRATLWLADNIKDNRDVRSKDRGDSLNPLYETLVAKHVGAEWFTDAVKSLASNKKYLGDDAAVAMLDTVVETAKADNAKAAALFFAATIVGESDAKKAKGYMDRIAKDYANTVYGTAARAASAKEEDSEQGKVAPTFVGETIDGFQFSLEDYRGKVVALDFYGFW